MIVYAITNRINGKRYIGMTQMRLADRWRAHKKSLRRGADTALYGAMRKYGEDAFEIAPFVSAVAWLTRDDLYALEALVIAQEQTTAPLGYNLIASGRGVPLGYKHIHPSKCKGKPWSEARFAKREQHCQKLREFWALHPERKAAAAARNKARCGTKATEEHKAALRAVWDREPWRRAKQAELMRARMQKKWSNQNG